MIKYIVVGGEKVFYNGDKYNDCVKFISKTLKKYPKHIKLNIYRLVR